MLANKRDDGQGPLREAILQEKCSFLNIVQKAFDPPPFISTFVLFCRGCFLKRVFEH